MAKIIKTQGNQFWFFCKGCDETHCFGAQWNFNDDYEKPTVSPSILVTWEAQPDAEEEFKEWRIARRCHSYITDGKIKFLDDCTHSLKGQTIDLEEITHV